MAVDRTERLLNLVLALLDSPQPVDRAAIRRLVPGYAESVSDDAFERMFERDKDELRSMGIPVDTVVNARGEVDGYRIDKDAYALPPVAFTAEELAVLGLAARVWDAAALRAQARSGVHKLGGTPSVSDDTSAVAEVAATASDAVVPLLWDAVRTRTPVRFAYRRPGEPHATDRIVEPWGVVAYGSGWYLVGRDRDRDALRSFRTTRIVASVAPAGEPGSFVADDVDLRALVDSWDPRVGSHGPETARVRMVTAGGAPLRWRAAEAHGDIVTIPFADEAALVAEVCALGPEAELLDPVAARTAVLAALERIAADHGPDEAAG